jgi:hypothetical protein
MATAVRLSDEVVQDAKTQAGRYFRSAPEQIEYWYHLGKTAEENPDLPLTFIKGAMEGFAEMSRGEVSAFEFRHANED